jgi:hypothetical protein
MFPTKPLRTIFFSVWLIITLGSCTEEVVEREYNDDEVIIFIQSPLYESKFFVGETVIFEGSAGTSNGFLKGEKLVWTSNIDGVIGYSETFSRDDLSEGSHEITLTGANEAGESIHYSVPIELFRKTDRERHQIKTNKHIELVVDVVDDGIYIDADDGTIVDTTTGLMWQKSPDNASRDYHSAIKYANNLKLAGYDDWRMPTIEELLIISDIYLSKSERKAFNLSKKAFLSGHVISKVFDTMNGHFWAFQRPYNNTGQTLAANAVRYRYNSTVTNYFHASPGVYEI